MNSSEFLKQNLFLRNYLIPKFKHSLEIITRIFHKIIRNNLEEEGDLRTVTSFTSGHSSFKFFMESRCEFTIFTWRRSPSPPDYSNKEIALIHLLINEMLRPPVTGDGLLPSKQLDLIPQFICPRLVELDNYITYGSPFILQITRRSKKGTKDFSCTRHVRISI